MNAANKTTLADLRARASTIGIVVEDHPYDIGYFQRLFGATRPTNTKGREGWDDCNRELRASPSSNTGEPK